MILKKMYSKNWVYEKNYLFSKKYMTISLGKDTKMYKS